MRARNTSVPATASQFIQETRHETQGTLAVDFVETDVGTCRIN